MKGEKFVLISSGNLGFLEAQMSLKNNDHSSVEKTNIYISFTGRPGLTEHVRKKIAAIVQIRSAGKGGILQQLHLNSVPV